MKFILIEEFEEKEPAEVETAEQEKKEEPSAEDKVTEITDSVKVELKEGLDYKQHLINDSKSIARQLLEFVEEVKEDPNCAEFMSQENADVLSTGVDILMSFFRSYSKYATQKAREFAARNRNKEL